MAWIQIFKAGKHTSSNGVTATYGNDFQQAVVDNYNANVGTHSAPLTLGHNPKSGDPAQGWFKQLRLNGDVLEGELDDVNPSFNTAQYKKVSSSFFLPDSPSNPTPGYPNLRHVAALGAETPAVAGLKNISFSEDSTGVVEFADGLSTQVGLFRSLREWIIAKFGMEDADQAVPAADVEWLNTVNTFNQVDDAVEASSAFSAAADTTVAASTTAAPTSADQTGGGSAPATVAPAVAPEFAAPTTAEPSVDFAAREASLSAKAAELATREAALRHAETVSFCAGLVSSGQLRPCDKANAENMLASLYTVSGSVDFSDSATLPIADAFKAFLSGMPKLVEFGEVAKEEQAPTRHVADFAVAQGYEVDQAGEVVRKEIVALADRLGISFTEAAARYTAR